MKHRRIAHLGVAALILLITVPSLAAEGPAPQGEFEGIPIMPGGVIVDGRIVYSGGAVVVVPAADIDSFNSCPSGWVCLFQSPSWQGNMLQFNACCSWTNLSAYGFDNKASSWRNRMLVDAQIAKDPGGGGALLCLRSGSYAASMTAGWDKTASSIRVRSSAGAC